MQFPDLDDLAARFTACRIPKEEWTHQAHLAVGSWHVHRYGPDEALLRLRTGIRRLNESYGGANTSTGGYHETITRAYVLLLADFLDAADPNEPLEQRVERFLAGPLAARDALLRFYSRDRLMSVDARVGWLEPDLGAIRAAGPRRDLVGSS